MTKIIGISSYFHDSAVALIIDGKVVYAAQEERFTRIKHDFNFPLKSLKNLLEFNKLKIEDIDYFVFFEKPFLKFERLIETYLALAPKGIIQFLKAMPIWLNQKLFMKKIIEREINKISKNFDIKKLFFSEHHLSHAASCFYPSPFDKSVVFTADGVGEWTTTSVAIGKKNKLEIIKEIYFPHSLGLLYSAFTYYIGFKVNSGEYKLMGLAPYGKPIYAKLIKKNLIDIKEDGSFRLNMRYFDYATGLKMTNKKFENLFAKKRREPESTINKFHMNVAASIQQVTEEIILKITNAISEEYGISNLCMAGGVALNCVANGKILKKNKFKKIWIQPAAGDAGGAVGAALAFWFLHLKNKRITNKNSMRGSFLGNSFLKKEIKQELQKKDAVFKELSEEEILKKTALAISKGMAVGWFQGRMEFGPRALGGRSILADPRNPEMQKVLNLKIKYRESFRPFAPSILEEKVSEWFELKEKSPYMLLVAEVKKSKLFDKKIDNQSFKSLNEKRSLIPAVTHIDQSARVQTVSKTDNPKFYRLIKEFYRLTKVPMLINTSFNIRGEPIVQNANDAFRCFMGTDLDLLVVDNFLLEKKNQKKHLIKGYKHEFRLD